MNDFLFDLLNDDGRCCNICTHFFRNMKKADVYYIQNANPDAGRHKEGQKFCVKTKQFVYFYGCCTEFTRVTR